jgi:hypothetical protein
MRELVFGGKQKEPDIRWLYDMKDVIYDQAWLTGTQNIEQPLRGCLEFASPRTIRIESLGLFAKRKG